MTGKDVIRARVERPEIEPTSCRMLHPARQAATFSSVADYAPDAVAAPSLAGCTGYFRIRYRTVRDSARTAATELPAIEWIARRSNRVRRANEAGADRER